MKEDGRREMEVFEGSGEGVEASRDEETFGTPPKRPPALRMSMRTQEGR
jgi:hypothetical protein